MAYQPPLFEAKQIVDTRYRTRIAGIDVRMPDRNYIKMVYRMDTSNTWMLGVISEAKGGEYYVQQGQLFNNMSRHTSEVYNNRDIKMMLDMGYRFVKNVKILTVVDQNKYDDLIDGLSKIDEIEEVATMNAYEPDGTALDPNQYVGIWVKYKTVINTDGIHITPSINVVYKSS